MLELVEKNDYLSIYKNLNKILGNAKFSYDILYLYPDLLFSVHPNNY